MLCECHYQQFEKGETSDRAYYLHILPLRVIHLFPRNCTNYLTRLEKVRLVVNQGHCVAQVVGEMPTKHLPRGPPLDSYIQRLSFPTGYSGFTYLIIYIVNNKANDHPVSMRRSITSRKNIHAKWRWSTMQNSVGVPDKFDRWSM